MAGEARTATEALRVEQALEREPYRFGFFQALRLLENAHRDRPRIGQSSRPADDPVRLAQQPSMAFAPATLAGFARGRAGRPPRLEVLFFGLFGPNGPLPLHLTEYARQRLRTRNDPTFARFADLFHHRLLSLFYRAWAAARPEVGLDRPDSDRFALYVGSLIGIGQPSLRNRDALPDPAKLFHAGHLGCQTRHPDGLRSMLASYFEMPVEVEEFVGRWIDLPANSHWRLGETPETGSLGATTVIGARTWDVQGKFRIRLGPLSREQYQRLLPGSASLDRLTALVRGYVGDELSWELNLVLRKEDTPPLRLGGPERLGLTMWLASRRPDEDRDDLLIHPLASESETDTPEGTAVSAAPRAGV